MIHPQKLRKKKRAPHLLTRGDAVYSMLEKRRASFSQVMECDIADLKIEKMTLSLQSRYLVISRTLKEDFCLFCEEFHWISEESSVTHPLTSSSSHQNSVLTSPNSFSCLDWLRHIERFSYIHLGIRKVNLYFLMSDDFYPGFSYSHPAFFGFHRVGIVKITSDRYISTTKHVLETAASAFWSSSQ